MTSKGADTSRDPHVLTLTPFFPSQENEVSGCFVAEPIMQLSQFGIASSVIAVSPLHHARKQPMASAPAQWMRYPQVPGNLGLSSAGRLLFARLVGRVSELHARKSVDVIHAHAALPCGQAAAILSRRFNIPFVVSVHGLDVFNSCFVEGTVAVWRRKSSIDVYGAANRVICVSGKVQENLRAGALPQTHSSVVYNGVDPDLFSPVPGMPEQQDLEILVVGNLICSKGQELVLRAMANLRTPFPQVRCRMIGEGPDRDRLEALVRGLGIDGRVMFEGRKSRAEVAEAMRRCSVFVLPSSNEGLGCVYLEAMSCGKPAIGCRGQGIEEIIDHGSNGWLVPVEGLDDLTQGLVALLGSPELRKRIGIAARQTILQNLTLRHQAQELAEIYRQAVDRSKR